MMSLSCLSFQQGVVWGGEKVNVCCKWGGYFIIGVVCWSDWIGEAGCFGACVFLWGLNDGRIGGEVV